MRNPKTRIPNPTSQSTRPGICVAAAFALLIASGVGAQSPASQTFDVASVKANRSGQPLQILPTLQPGGRVFAINLPLREFITAAYGLQDNQLVMAFPLAEARFDVEARAGADATREQAGMMLRTLLIERFGLKTHAETRVLPVYSLERVNSARLGPQMRPAGTECAPLTFPSGPGAPPPPPPPPPALSGTPLGSARVWALCPTAFFPGGLSARSMDMYAFSVALERRVRRPVVDKTGLSGLFDFDMTYTPDLQEFPFPAAVVGGRERTPEAAVPSADHGPSLFTALRDQLGLRLESGRAPIDVVVVDDVRQPTEN